MKVRINYTLQDGIRTEDSIVLEGTLEDIRARAVQEVESRNAINPWSEVLEET